VGSSNNPVSGMTLSALIAVSLCLLVAGISGAQGVLAALCIAAAVCGAACSAADCSQDLKTGQILGSTPRRQQWAEILGAIFPALLIAPTLSLLHAAYGIGTGLKAPQATLFANLSQGIFGNGSLPWGWMAIGAGIAVALLIVDGVFLRGRSFRLHAMPVAVGMYLPFTLSAAIALGGLVQALSSRKKSPAGEPPFQRGVVFASGLIAGESLMGIGLALGVYAGVKSAGFTLPFGPVFSVAGFAGLLLFLARMARKQPSAR
jgi:putative OPT family oligopeptide transporter